MLFTGIAIWHVVKKRSFASQQQAITVGIVWIILTEVFEVLLILSNPKNSFDNFFHAHNIAAGELWLVFVLWIGIAPVIFYRMQSKKI